jgi:hypothetical protein
MEQRITIVVSGGMVQNVFTTIDNDVEVDILDFDDNGALTATERGDMDTYYACVKAEQRAIY